MKVIHPGDAPEPMFGSPCGPWHRWFAWYPVKTYDRRLVFLSHVFRRRIQIHDHLFGAGRIDQWWQYTVVPQGVVHSGNRTSAGVSVD